ncbi:sulfatase-like hydrolase/transferase [bacterium]|nr:sulfatase-like hydrolase/transferase [bacterium]
MSSWFSNVAHPSETAERSNILWLIGEDLCPDLGCYGTQVVKTPNLDRLASEGAMFTNAFNERETA